MTSTAQQYVSEIRQALKYHAAWLPGSKLTLGTIGDVQDDVFVPMDTITGELGISVQFEELPHEGTDSLTYQSQSGVIIQTKASGATSTAFKYLGEADAGMSISFGKRGACVLSLREYRTHRIANQIRLQRELLQRIDYQWKPSYAVITEVVVAKTGTILVCEDNQAYIELFAKGEITNPITDVGDVNLAFKVAHTEGHVFSIVGASHLTPLFRAIRVKKSFLGTISMGALGGDNDEVDISTLSDDAVTNAFEELPL